MTTICYVGTGAILVFGVLMFFEPFRELISNLFHLMDIFD